MFKWLRKRFKQLRVRLIPTNNEVISQFYKEYSDWLDNGAGLHLYFRRIDGLCEALYRYAKPRVNLERTKQIVLSLQFDFQSYHLHRKFPFGGHNVYAQEQATSTMHLNEARIAWVKERVRKSA